MRSRLSSLMPGPWSETENSIRLPTRRRSTRTRPPGGEKERAFDSRFCTTWARRVSRPMTIQALSRRIPEGSGAMCSSALASPSRAVSLARETSVSSRRAISTGETCERVSSASSLEALEMSEIRRSSLLTSSVTISTSRSRCSFVRATRRVSTAERREVRGFFSSWATSAAKASMASMRP